MDEAQEIERILLDTGRALLRQNKIDKFRSLLYISQYFASRVYLLEKAAPFMAKAYVAFKEKMGADAEVTR